MGNRQPRRCAREECGVEFYAAVHNQRFCTKECCKVHTNKRILAQYHERKNNKKKVRTCADKNCGTILSRYNAGTYCSMHESGEYLKELKRWEQE